MKNLENKLLDIKEQISEKQTEKNRMEGELKAVTKSILTLTNCKTIKAAIAKNEKLHKEFLKKEKKFRNDVLAIEEEFYDKVN